MFPSELIALHTQREKQILDTWLTTRGLDVVVKPVKMTDGVNNVVHDLDPFNIDVNRIGYEEGSITQYELEFDQKAVFVNEQFQFNDISFDIFMEESTSSADSSNFNEVYCFIGGEIVPKYSIITFKNFPSVSLRVDEISKKRPLSDVYRYKLVRC